MLKKFLRKAALHLGGVLVILLVAYGFREGLVRLAANRVLADSGLTLTALQGLQLGATHAAVDELRLELASGVQITLADLAVDYQVVSLTSAPVVQSLTIASARVSEAASLPATDTTDAANSDTLLLSDVLQLLRGFPLDTIAVSELALPQRTEPLAVNIQRGNGELSARFDSGALQLLVRFTQAEATAIADLQVTLTRAADMVGNFHLLLQPAGSTFGLNGSGHLQFADLNTLLGELQQQPLPLPLKAASLDWQLQGSVADAVRGTFRQDPNAAAPAMFVFGLQAGSTLALPAALTDGLGELVVTFTDNAELNIATGADPAISNGRLPLQLTGSWQQQPVNINSLFTVADCTANYCRIGFNGDARFADYTLSGAITIDAAALAAGSSTFGIQTTDLQLGALSTWIPAFDIDAAVELVQNRLSFSTPLLLRDAAADAGISVSGSYDLPSGAASAHVAIPSLQFTENGRALSAFLRGWPYAFDVLTGTVTAGIDVQWQPAAAAVANSLRASVDATLQDVAGFYGDYFFRGLNGDLQGNADIADTLALDTPPLTLTVASVDVGVPLDKVAMDFRFDGASHQLLVNSLSADVLGGTVSGNSLTYDFTRERNALTLRFDGLQMERMLALADYDGVAAIGAVSGELPLTLTATGVEVAAGTLKADAPGGSIRYLAAAAAGVQGNAGVDLVNQVLGNYRFESLNSTIDYSPEGELLLSMQLQGHNPDMGSDQPINLNLNLSDNIPALLKSLQSARAIEDFLQQQRP